MTSPSDITSDKQIILPCYKATYRREHRESLEWLAQAFAYSNVNELANLNGIPDKSTLEKFANINLPGWNYFYAREGDSLEKIDKMFKLSVGWTRTVGRVYHPDPRLPYESETIVVPTQEFVSNHVLK